ncbi:MAG: coaX, partial [Firmicutes bacterium]|nr:coaX [Bacillota bacterium]
KCRVIATGGLGKIISDATDVIEVYDPNLTMKGLKIISDKNKNRP